MIAARMFLYGTDSCRKGLVICLEGLYLPLGHSYKPQTTQQLNLKTHFI